MTNEIVDDLQSSLDQFHEIAEDFSIPGTTYYFTVRVLGANGAYVDSVQQGGMTAKAFWQQDWFPNVVFFTVLIGVAAIVIYVLGTRYRKKAQVT